MPQYNRRMSNKSAQPLRPDAVSTQFTSYQMAVYGVFLTAILSGGVGIYTSLVRNGGAIRVRLYSGDDSYEDTIFPADDLAYLLTEYASQFKVKEEFVGGIARLHATAPQSQSEPREGGEGTPGTAKGGSKPLRSS